MMHKLRGGYKEKWVQKGYVMGAQADSAEATKKKKPPRSRRSRHTKKSSKAVAKVEEVATWSVAKASSSSATKTSDSEDSSSTDSADSADDDEVEVCEVGCASKKDAQEAYWEEQQCPLDGALSSDDSGLEGAYEADVGCSGAATDDDDQDQPLLPTASAWPGRGLTRAAPAGMPYMALQRGGVLKPCSRGDGDRACDACAEAGEGNSAHIAALQHASL
jgi:hypothetical protein